MNRVSIILAASLTACLPLPPEHTYDDERSVTIDWSLKGPDDVAGDCPSGFDTIRVAACTTEDLYSCFQATVPCEASGSKNLTVYTSGRYRPDDDSSFWDLTSTYWVYTSIIDPSDPDYPHSSSPATMIDLEDGDKAVDTTLYPEAGFLNLRWELTSASTGDYASRCSQYDIDEIELEFGENTGSNSTLDKSAKWDCESRDGLDPDSSTLGAGTTKALEPTDYVGNAIAYRAGVEVGRYEDVTFTIEGRAEVSDASVYIEITDR